MTVEVFFNFNKSVMVRSTIESKGIDSSTEGIDKMAGEMRKYLTVMEKKLLKPKKETPETRLEEQAETIAELEKELRELKEAQKSEAGKQKELEKASMQKGITALVLLVLVLGQLAYILLG